MVHAFRKTRKIRVKDWSDDPVVIQELSLGDVGDLAGFQADKVTFAMELVGRCLLDEDGNAVGANWLRNEVGASKLKGLMALLEHCQDLNGFVDEGSSDENKGEADSPLSGASDETAAGSGARKNSRGVGKTSNAA